MAESLVQVTEGAGKKLRTWSRAIAGNTVEEEAVFLAEQNIPTWRVMTGTTYLSTAVADSHLIQCMAGPTLALYVRRIRVYQHGPVTAAAFGTAQVFRLTTAGTGGTVFTPAPLDAGDGAFSGAVMTLPTAKGAEGPNIDQAEGYFLQTIAASLGVPVQPLVFDFDFTTLRGKALRVAPGITNGVAVKLRTALAAGTVAVVAEVAEASY